MNEAVPGPAGARIGDAERERALHTLSHHVGTGRLSLTEFEARSTIAANASTPAELARVLVDLPIAVTPAPGPARLPLVPTGVLTTSIAILAVVAAMTIGNWWWLALLCAIPALIAYRRTR